MPVNFYIALGSVFGVCLGLIGYVWFSTPRAHKKGTNEAQPESFAHDIMKESQRPTSPQALAGMGGRR